MTTGQRMLDYELQASNIKDNQNRGARITITGLKFKESVTRVRPTWKKAIILGNIIQTQSNSYRENDAKLCSELLIVNKFVANILN